MGKGACWSSVNLISQSTNYFIHFLDINLKTYAFCNFFFPFFTHFPLALLASLLHEFNYVNQNAELCHSRCHVFYSVHWVGLVRLRRERKRVGERQRESMGHWVFVAAQTIPSSCSAIWGDHQSLLKLLSNTQVQSMLNRLVKMSGNSEVWNTGQILLLPTWVEMSSKWTTLKKV